ncbi:hypothetical protein QYE76_035696 [Lolium multiflorum]|uniref:Aminotransferase-like plant mobile domain-containing protein n=1 Tax=Lolium multiflorum TaxID=4521 RepID=A0AAD8QZP7_LOLMU|nr:hypothetical protein QYE76_035696 [Lolium multiflorum]
MNAAALTALVDRWRPETHTFHLRAGEMTPTLQDVSMILGLPIQGEPLCMNTASDGWRRQMEDLIGMAPPPPAHPKERAPAGAPFGWIRLNFGECPEEANRDTIKTYTRVYLWYMISRTLFADSGGKLAHWRWLKALTVLEHPWSWGSAALAYLYRQGYVAKSHSRLCGAENTREKELSGRCRGNFLLEGEIDAIVTAIELDIISIVITIIFIIITAISTAAPRRRCNNLGLILIV